MIRSRLCLVFVALLSAAFAKANGPVDLVEMPVFLGQGDSAVDTLKVRLENRSDLAQAAVVTAPGGAEYPVTVAPHSFATAYLYKVVVPYPAGTITMHAAPVDGKGERSDVDLRLMPNGIGASTRYLAIGASSENVAYLASNESVAYRSDTTRAYSGNGDANAYWCDAKSAPPRPSAYEAFNAVFLSSSATSKLSDASVAALKDYVLEGGEVVFPLHVTDPRWKGFAPDYRGGKLLGLGSVIAFGFDPCNLTKEQQSLNRKSILGQISRSQTLTGASNAVDDPQDSYMSRGPSLDGSAHVKDDPFAASLPPFGKVLGLLCLYFVAVVPLNFFVLKRVRRPELTWLTAPVLAIIFGGVLFSSASALYKANASRATRGTLLLQEGVSDGLFVGTSDLFVPHAGTVSLELKDIDRIGEGTSDMNYGVYYSGNSQGGSLAARPRPIAGAVDNGTIQIPKFETHNLEFTQVNYAQRVKAENWFTFKQLPKKDVFIPFKVTNNSPYTIRDAVLVAGDISSPAKDLRPGEAMTVQTVATPDTNARQPVGLTSEAPRSDSDISSLLASDRRVALRGTVEGLSVGPQIGQLIASRSDIEIAAFAPSNMRLPVLYLSLPKHATKLKKPVAPVIVGGPGPGAFGAPARGAGPIVETAAGRP